MLKDTLCYKQNNEYKLRMDIYYPDENKSNHRGIMLFFGGAWQTGDKGQFSPQARKLAELGYTVFTPEYRIASLYPVTPFDCVADGKDAWLFVQERAESFGVDNGRLVLGGGSSGGHVALMAAVESGKLPEAFILFNPVSNMMMPEVEKVLGEAAVLISPYHQIQTAYPPILLFHGEADTLVPLHYSVQFCEKMKSLHTPVTLYTYPGQDHGFFNRDVSQSNYEDTLEKVIRFLEEM